MLCTVETVRQLNSEPEVLLNHRCDSVLVKKEENSWCKCK